MVALLHPQPVHRKPVHRQPGSLDFQGLGVPFRTTDRPGQLSLVVDNTVPEVRTRAAVASPRSSEIAGLRSEIDTRSIVAMVLAAAVVVFGGLMTIRLVQGSPTVATQSSARVVPTVSAIAETAAVVAAPGDRIVVAQPGDSMWSIAESIAAGNDPRPIVASLIEINGGDSVQIGQQIVIPRQLLD